jgi:hypothetical protein
MEILLSYSLFDTGEADTGVFTLSGFFTGYSHIVEDKPAIIFASHSFYEIAARNTNMELLALERNAVKLIFTAPENISLYTERLMQEFGLTENQIEISPAFRQGFDSGDERIFVFSFIAEIHIISAIATIFLILIVWAVSVKRKREGRDG